MKDANKEPKSGLKNDKIKFYTVTEPIELLQFLFSIFPEKSKTTVKSYLANRQVMVNNKVVKQFNHPLQPADEVSLTFAMVSEQSHYPGIVIVYEDPYLVVIDKNPGMLSIATDGGSEMTAYSLLSSHVKKSNPNNKIFVIHRLDRETSGIMMFAKSTEVQELLQKDWQESIMERNYVAVVEGEMEKEEGTIESWLTESKALLVYASPVNNGGQHALLHYKVIRRSKTLTMVEVELETGRKNQIRVQMKQIGHSIIGDKKYGSTINPIKRIALHAKILAFTHPITKKPLRFTTNIPRSFIRIFK